MPNLTTQLPGHAQEAELTESERCHILRDERRRQVLDILTEHAAGIGLDDLAERVADRTDVVARGQTTINRVAISLHHKHLPMLDDYDVIEYDQDAHWVR